MAMIHEIVQDAGVSITSSFSLKDAILVIIAWCDKNPEKKIISISWLFTLRCKHLAKALRVVLGQIEG